MKAKRHVYDLNRVSLWEQLPLRTPYHISIEPTFRCNIRCNYCIHAMSADEIHRRGYSLRDMEWDVFERIVHSIYEFDDPIKSVVFSGLGEPLVNKRLPEMVRRIKETSRVEKILLVTNGLLLTPETSDALIEAGLDICKLSLQGITAESYQKTSNISLNWEEFYQNIVYFSEHRKSCILKAKVGDISLSPAEIEQFYKEFGDICDFVDVEHIYPQFDGVDYSRTVLQDEGKNRFWHPLNQLKVCSPLFFRLYVLQDGRVTFGYPDGILYEGFQIKEKSLREIWESNETKDLWTRALRHQLPVCQKCPRWSYSAHPADILDGHEEEILAKLSAPSCPVSARQVLCVEN